MRASVVVVAGGRGERLGGDVPKPLRMFGGRTLLERSIYPFDTVDVIHEVVVVLPPTWSRLRRNAYSAFGQISGSWPGETAVRTP